MSGLSFPSCAEKRRESEFVLAGTGVKALCAFLEVCRALFKSLKKSEASVAVRPVTVGSFLLGWYLRASCQYQKGRRRHQRRGIAVFHMR